MENRVVVEAPVPGVFTPLGLLFRKFGDVYAPEDSMSFGLHEALQDIRDACAASNLPEMEVDVLDTLADHFTAHVRNQMRRDDCDGLLNECDRVVILLYTCEFPDTISLYDVLNKKLNIPDRNQVKPFVKYIWLLLRALVKCPSAPCKLVYRGVKNADLTSYYPDNHELEWHQFSSCSTSLAVQNRFTGPVGLRTLFTIELTSNRGRDICAYSAIPREQEVLLSPNTKFKVKSTFAAGAGLNMIHVVEIPATDPVIIFRETSLSSNLPISPAESVAGCISADSYSDAELLLPPTPGGLSQSASCGAGFGDELSREVSALSRSVFVCRIQIYHFY
jgi:hypothetical protein